MRIFRSMLAIFIAIFVLSNIDRENDNRLAAPEEAAIFSDHSACESVIAAREAEIDSLRIELAQARRSADMILRIEIELAPGLFGDWASVCFRSVPIRISAAAAENFSEGDDLGSSLISDSAILERIIACRIIIDSIAVSA